MFSTDHWKMGVRMEAREAKDRLYEVFARTAQAAASPKRIELLELLAQGERTVERLAEATGMGVTNTSAHLQVLSRSRLVLTRKAGTRVFYRLSGDDVAGFLAVLRNLARRHLPEVEQVVRDYFTARDALEPVSRAELVTRAERGDVVILDVRPAEEFAAGHIPGALSVPLNVLDSALLDLSRERDVVAYCRGPYCVLAPQAVERLRAHGYRVRRLAEGLPEWRLAGLPVAAGGGDRP
jgi:rhodanese-related sulfurtransferase/DNA-binding transcriptional ArsR family regulator